MYIHKHTHKHTHMKSVGAVFMVVHVQSSGYHCAPHGYAELVQQNPSRDWANRLQDASCMM